MTIYNPPQDALIYRGNLGSSIREGSLSRAFADVTGSSQNYRVKVDGYAFRNKNEPFSLEFMARQLASIITAKGLQDEPGIEKVASAVHRVLYGMHQARSQNDTAPFDYVPVIATLHKPGRIKNAGEIFTSLSDEDRVRYTREIKTLTPENM